MTVGITTYNNYPFFCELIYVIDEQVKKTPQLLEQVDFTIIDDASDDAQLMIQFDNLPSYFTLICNSENQGSPAFGRNRLIDSVQTEYLLFMDGDDTFVGNITDVVQELEKNTADIFVSNVTKVLHDGILSESPFVYSENLFFKKNSEQNIIKMAIHQTGIWSIYNVSFLREHKIYYQKAFRYEDNYFMTCIYLHNPRIGLLKTKYYGWRTNYQSFSFSADHFSERLSVYRGILELLETNANHPYAPWLFYSIWNQTYLNIIRSYPTKTSKEYKQYFKSLEQISSKYQRQITRFIQSLDNEYIDLYTKFIKITNINAYFVINFLRIFKQYRSQEWQVKIKMKILQLIQFLPLNKKKIFITSHYGDYSDNSKYLYKKLKQDRAYQNYRFVFAVKNSELFSKEKDFINYNNRLAFFYHHYTAGHVYFNTWYNPLISKKRGQIWTQLWHGIPYKKIHRDIPVYKMVISDKKRKERDAGINRWDEVYSVNAYNTKIFKNLFPNVKIIEREYFKTEWLIEHQWDKEYIQKLQEKYQLDDQIVLYAPTYRPYKFYLDIAKIINLVDWEKGEQLAIHLHPMMIYEYLHPELLKKYNIRILENVDDIQEIVLVTKSLITDYSSIAYDYEKINKDIRYYRPDQELYSAIQGVYEYVSGGTR